MELTSHGARALSAQVMQYTFIYYPYCELSKHSVSTAGRIFFIYKIIIFLTAAEVLKVALLRSFPAEESPTVNV
jgi:hypothetical protein